MDQLLNDGEEAVRKGKEREIRRHFSPRYGQMAATVLVFLVAGFLVWNVKDLFHSEIASESAETETAMDTSTYDDAVLEESAAEDIEEAMATADSADAADAERSSRCRTGEPDSGGRGVGEGRG